MGEVCARLTENVKSIPVPSAMKPTVAEPPRQAFSEPAAAALRAARDGWWPNVATASAQPPTQ
jgi:hypothetical protein